MNNGNEIKEETEMHVTVSAAYRASATEAVPAHLDRAVLMEARRSAGKRIFSPWFPAWIRPVTFAATIVLSLAVLLDYELMNSLLLPVDEPRSMPGAPASTTQSASDLAAAVESTGRRLRELDNAADGLLPGNKPAPGTPDDRAASRSQLTVDARTDRHCDPELTISAESWWTCIDELRREGLTEAANAELELLKDAFPDFDPRR